MGIIFVFIKEHRNQIFPLAVLNLAAWLTKVNVPAIPTRAQAASSHLFK